MQSISVQFALTVDSVAEVTKIFGALLGARNNQSVVVSIIISLLNFFCNLLITIEWIHPNQDLCKSHSGTKDE